MKTQISKKKTFKSGSMLPLAVTIVVILALVGAGLICLGGNALFQSIRDVKQVSSRSAADAGIEHAIRYMIDSWNSATNKANWVASWNDETVWTDPAVPPAGVDAKYTSAEISLGSDTYGNAKFQYKIYPSTRLKGYQIFSTGTAGGTTRIVHAAAVLKSSFFGVGAKEDIYLSPNVDLRTVPDGKTIRVQTNSTEEDVIDIKSGVTVPGDVVCGPGGDPEEAIKNQGTIEGQEMAAEEEIDFPPIDAPSYPVGTVAPTAEPNIVTIGTAGEDTSIQLNGLYFGSGDLTGVDTLEIYGNVDIFVNGETYLPPSTQIIVTVDSSMTLYLGGNLWAQPQSDIIYAGDVSTEDDILEAALSISIKGTVAPDGTPLCNEIHLQPKGDFYGTIYAPDASVEVWPNGDFYGAVVGGYSVIIKPGGSYYYIPALVDTQDEEVLYMGIKYGSWWDEVVP